MQPITFDEMEKELLGANGNPNTLAMPYCMATNPEVSGTMPYFISKWAFSDEEKRDFVEKVFHIIQKQRSTIDFGDYVDRQILQTSLEECYDHVWLSLMHSAVPALVISQNPFETAGYVRLEIKPPANNRNSLLARVHMTTEADDAKVYLFHCPGCGFDHAISEKIHKFNEDFEKPSFSPSLLNNHNSERICHSYITDGKIQFLSDCWHELKNKTVDIPVWAVNKN